MSEISSFDKINRLEKLIDKTKRDISEYIKLNVTHDQNIINSYNRVIEVLELQIKREKERMKK